MHFFTILLFALSFFSQSIQAIPRDYLQDKADSEPSFSNRHQLVFAEGGLPVFTDSYPAEDKICGYLPAGSPVEVMGKPNSYNMVEIVAPGLTSCQGKQFFIQSGFLQEARVAG